MVRSFSGGAISASGTGYYNFYCRTCGKIFDKRAIPTMCTKCGNILSDQGFGISGDSAANTTTSVSWATYSWSRITTIDKRLR